ncbi:NAD(P)/FAD-dependent oxidoreductase [Afifella pfennigii]|uniref:NAD(P)/FAD-dependent oxidoreductase n=1 Tax=Afifella pfennigii TaxID=209897 RepID=UPI00068B1939
MLRPFPPSWYHIAAEPVPERPRLEGEEKADVCVVGGGFAGLSAALHLAEAGASVALLEAGRLGHGASGRNGGQIHSGQRRDVLWLEAHYGFERAKALWDVAENAKTLVRQLAARFACPVADGLIETFHRTSDAHENERFVEALTSRYGYDQVTALNGAQVAEAVGSTAYVGGLRDAGGGHLDPYRFTLGLAAAAEGAGARLYETSAALSFERNGGFRVATEAGHVIAERLILATNGRSGRLENITRRRTLGIHSFMLATEPLGELAETVLPGNECASDSYFVICYWRKTPDGRLLFGGGESNAGAVPADIGAFVRPHLLRVYPQLRNVAIAHGWGGVISVTPERLPFIRSLGDGISAAAGFSGQGVALAPYIGKLLAEEALGRAPEELKLYADLKISRVPDSTFLRRALVRLALLRGKLADRM